MGIHEEITELYGRIPTEIRTPLELPHFKNCSVGG